MSSLVIFDTSVFVDYLRAGRHADEIAQVRGVVRNSSVVLAELWRGASTKEEHKFLRQLERIHPALTPTERNWLESGELLGRMFKNAGLLPAKLRDLHFDVLIALTARSYGARVITANRRDFELIRLYKKFDLEIW